MQWTSVVELGGFCDEQVHLQSKRASRATLAAHSVTSSGFGQRGSSQFKLGKVPTRPPPEDDQLNSNDK